MGFERQNARVVPVYAQEGRNEAAHFLSTCVQHHALQFVRDFHDTFAGTGVMQSLDNPGVQLAMSLPFEGALRQLPEADAELLRNIPFEDMVFAGENALDLRTLVRDQSAEAAVAAHELGEADAPSPHDWLHPGADRAGQADDWLPAVRPRNVSEEAAQADGNE